MMTKFLERDTMQFLKKILRNKTILFILLSGTVLSVSACAENFSISSKCKDEYNSNCEIIRTQNGKSTIIDKNVKLINITKINQNLYQVKASCGSPCLVNLFYNAEKEDSTDEFIAFDSKNNCLIESNSQKKLILARKLFTKKSKKIVDLNAEEFSELPEAFDYYSYFKGRSFFSRNGTLNLVVSFDESTKVVDKKIINPCGGLE